MENVLRTVPLLAGLHDADLARLAAKAERVSLAPGEVLFVEGAEGDRAYVVEEGELEILKHATNREILLSTSRAGDVIGEMAVLQAMPRTATVRAATNSTLVAIDGAAFNELVDESSAAARALLETMFTRWRETDAALRESEKLAQLGSLSAGVAHELNNPAAALVRAAGQLQSLLDATGDLGPEGALRLGTRRVMSSLARSDAEEAMEEALRNRGIEEPWRYAGAFVDLEVDPDSIEDFVGGEPSEALVSELVQRHEAAALAHEIVDASGRISEIVAALRSYSYLDRGAQQDVDINRGIADTLVMVRGKLKGIDVVTDYAADLPTIAGHGGELNQVWTNLVVNAADAMGDSGRLRIATRRDGAWVLVTIEDNGPGIPDEVLSRIFDPFFTTKAIGEGTGLGLDISRHIVQEQHGGELTVATEPGKTVFTVRLPITKGG